MPGQLYKPRYSFYKIEKSNSKTYLSQAILLSKALIDLKLDLCAPQRFLCVTLRNSARTKTPVLAIVCFKVGLNLCFMICAQNSLTSILSEPPRF
jgi:hypothetical protein